MKDLWRIPFTLLFLGVVTLAVLAIARFVPEMSVMFVVFSYLFMGLAICALGAEYMDRKMFVKLLVLWLPAIWSDRIRDWVTKW